MIIKDNKLPNKPPRFLNDPILTGSELRRPRARFFIIKSSSVEVLFKSFCETFIEIVSEFCRFDAFGKLNTR